MGLTIYPKDVKIDEAEINKRINKEEKVIKETIDSPKLLKIFLFESVKIRLLLRNMPDIFFEVTKPLYKSDIYYETRTYLHHENIFQN